MQKGCYALEQAAEGQVREYIREEIRTVSFGNARGVRNLFERILVCQANRLAALEQVSREELMTITAQDVSAAREGER